MFDAVILLSGSGTRSGLTYNKVFHKINSKQVFRYSIDEFLKSKNLNKLILVARSDELDLVKFLIGDIDKKKVVVVSGGENRQDSVNNGLMVAFSPIVLIHDAARPIITIDQIDKVYTTALENHSACLAVKTIDTVVRSTESEYQVLNRTELYNIQTPQGLRTEIFKEAMKKALEEGYYATDDVSLLLKYNGIRPIIVEGSYKNIKLTTIDDIEYLEFLLKEKKNEF